MIERNFENCSENLAARIIALAFKTEQKQSIFNALISVFKDFSLPNPAYIMPVMFLAGLVLSINTSSFIDIADYVDNLYLAI